MEFRCGGCGREFAEQEAMQLEMECQECGSAIVETLAPDMRDDVVNVSDVELADMDE